MNNDDLKQFVLHIQNFSDFLFHLTPFQFTMLGIILGVISCEALTTNQQNSLGNFLEEVGQILLTYNAQAETINGYRNRTYQEQIDELTIKVNQIFQNIKK